MVQFFLTTRKKTKMQCEKCHGVGKVDFSNIKGSHAWFPCWECLGSGVAYCCEGVKKEVEYDDVGNVVERRRD